jgi:hypothetical protein
MSKWKVWSQIKLTYNLRLSPFNLAMLLLLAGAYPLAKHLPPYLAWENNLIESLQALLLFLSALLCFSSQVAYTGRQGRTVGLIYLLFLGRELSWGRVFFPTGEMDALGPKFISMSSIPGHQLIHGVILVLILLVLRGLVRNFDWRVLGRIPVPVFTFVWLLLATLGQLSAERMLFSGLTPPQNQTLEELLELYIYLELFDLTLYYGIMQVYVRRQVQKWC